MKANSIGTIVRVGVALVAGLLAPACLAEVRPLLEYKFNETDGTNAVNSGTAGTNYNATMKDATFTATNLHSAAGTGVTGMDRDRAFDNTASSGMGAGNTGGSVQGPVFDVNNPLQSLTIMGWMNHLSSAYASAAMLYFNDGGAGEVERTELMWDGTGRLILQLGNGTTYERGYSTVGAYSQAMNQWVFFAATFDGAAASNQFKFYIGGATSAVSLLNAESCTVTQAMNYSTVGIGNLNANYGGTALPLDGMLDNFRLFGTNSGSSAALSLSEIERYRYMDSYVPPRGTVISVR